LNALYLGIMYLCSDLHYLVHLSSFKFAVLTDPIFISVACGSCLIWSSE